MCTMTFSTSWSNTFMKRYLHDDHSSSLAIYWGSLDVFNGSFNAQKRVNHINHQG